MCLSGSFTDISFSLALAMFLKVSFLASAHVILFLQLASFVCTIFARHKAVPKHFHLSNDQLDELDQAVRAGVKTDFGVVFYYLFCFPCSQMNVLCCSR